MFRAIQLLEKFIEFQNQGRRIYTRSDSLPRVQNGLGVALISTSKGILSDNEAREQKLGGEIICNIS